MRGFACTSGWTSRVPTGWATLSQGSQRTVVSLLAAPPEMPSATPGCQQGFINVGGTEPSQKAGAQRSTVTSRSQAVREQ